MKLLKILEESLPDIVYHFTSVHSVINMLETNMINLSSALGSNADLKPNRGKFNFLSTTRSKSSGYRRGDTKIVLNGQKLNYNYKSIPLDYWGYSKNPKDWTNKSAYIAALGSEQEDRIVSDKTSIPNIKKYILAIHINIENYKSKTLQKIKELTTQNNIPLFLYANQQDWLKQKNSIDYVPQIDDEYETNTSKILNDKYYYGFYDLATAIAYNNPENYKKIIEYINDENEIEKLNKLLDENIRKYFSKNAFYKEDALIKLQNIIHLNRSKNDSNINFLIELLIKDMRKLKVTTIKDYLEEKPYIGKKNLKTIKKELVNHIFSRVNEFAKEEINYRLQEWVEINGVYYNHAYESPEIIQFIDSYIQEIKKYVTNLVEKETNSLERLYHISDSDYIRKHINLKNITHNFNIRDNNDYLDLNEKIREILYYVIRNVSSEYREKSEELMKEYYKQFQN